MPIDKSPPNALPEFQRVEHFRGQQTWPRIACPLPDLGGIHAKCRDPVFTSKTDDAVEKRDDGVRQLRLLGLGFALAGVITYGLGNAADPQAILVPLLGFLGIATYTLEKTQGYTSGVSFGLIAFMAPIEIALSLGFVASVQEAVEIPGLERFGGDCFHSARWRHDLPLEGKEVAVVGNAASAIQFIPQIAPRVRSLHVFQRSANWMLPRNNRAYSEREKWIFSKLPGMARLYRWWIWLLFELRWPVFKGRRWLSERVERLALQAMHAQVKDPELRRALTPDYPIGGKRILISDDYYATLQRENVELVTDPIEEIKPTGIETKDGTFREDLDSRLVSRAVFGALDEVLLQLTLSSETPSDVSLEATQVSALLIDGLRARE